MSDKMQNGFSQIYAILVAQNVFERLSMDISPLNIKIFQENQNLPPMNIFHMTE